MGNCIGTLCSKIDTDPALSGKQQETKRNGAQDKSQYGKRISHDFSRDLSIIVEETSEQLSVHSVPFSPLRSCLRNGSSHQSISCTSLGDASTGSKTRRRGIAIESNNGVVPFSYWQGERRRDWAKSVLHSDPRWQIMTFFDDIAQAGVSKIEEEGRIDLMALSPLLRAFSRASVFTVWRPTSNDAIRKMMLGQATGKGLNVKGKSAKMGILSGFVPFLQIHKNEHKRKIATLPKDARIRVFFKTQYLRDKAVETLQVILKEMVDAVEESIHLLEESEINNADADDIIFERMVYWIMDDPTIVPIDNYNPVCSGIDIPERLFWEAFVARKDITRPIGSPMYTGRPSMPEFQDMNFAASRKEPVFDPKPVVWQLGNGDTNGDNSSEQDPLCPLTLLVAYEEDGRVLPVASDFDGFLMGTRKVPYKSPLPPEQLEILRWNVSQIETILDNPQSRSDSWSHNWLGVLKKAAKQGLHPKVPQFGFGDPKSYSIMENAVERLKGNGAVRHGSECFNYSFPQELDDKYLVISGSFPDGSPWKYLSEPELQEYLCDRIQEGYTFPLNPKWVMCDEGWKEVYDKLCASQHAHVQDSLNVWFPPDIRERIDKVHERHPMGFERETNPTSPAIQHRSGRAEIDLAELELERFLTLERARKKLRMVLIWMKFTRTARKLSLDRRKSVFACVQEMEQE